MLNFVQVLDNRFIKNNGSGSCLTVLLSPECLSFNWSFHLITAVCCGNPSGNSLFSENLLHSKMCDSCLVIQTVQLLLALQAVSWVVFCVWGTRKSQSLLKEQCGDEVPPCWVHLYHSGKLRKLGETLKGRMGCGQLFSYHQTIFCLSPLQPLFQPKTDIWKSSLQCKPLLGVSQLFHTFNYCFPLITWQWTLEDGRFDPICEERGKNVLTWKGWQI